MLRTFKNLMQDESGATAIEYGLIAALVSVAAITALQAMGSSLDTIFGIVSTELNDAASGVQQTGTGG
ncbi:Flp family type IVb pilin [Desertibaculum subflavum]|uniref:Flp family type IVb pilin n=1 Tax=Desertibaculum subflavum TaxID=2268458 RepID=UPI000E667A03